MKHGYPHFSTGTYMFQRIPTLFNFDDNELRITQPTPTLLAVHLPPGHLPPTALGPPPTIPCAIKIGVSDLKNKNKNKNTPPGGFRSRWTHLLIQGRDDPVRLLVDELDAVLVVRELDEVPLDLLALVLLLSKTKNIKHTHVDWLRFRLFRSYQPVLPSVQRYTPSTIYLYIDLVINSQV